MKPVFLSFLLPLLMANCSGGSKQEYATESVAAAPMYDGKMASADDALAQNGETKVTDRKLIVTGNVRIRTTDMKNRQTGVLGLVEKYKGYIASQNESNSDYSLEQTIEVRIPSKDFTPFLSALSKNIDQFDSKNINTQDVTEEYIDVEARLKTKKELEVRYQQILGKANSVKDIMEVEAQLNGIRSEIESIEGRLKYLNNQTGYSTLTINFYKLSTQMHGFGFRFGEEFKQGWNAFITFLLAIVRLWPFLFIVLPFILLVRRWWKKRRS